MRSDVKDIAERALRLSSIARAYIAEILLESLDFEEDFPITDEWMSEIQRRCREIDNREVELIQGEAAISELQRKYS